MIFDIKFDRKITRNHYISPGAYEIVANNKSYRFDFFNACGTIDEDDPTLLHMEVWDLDEDYSSDMRDFNVGAIEKFEDFYIYTEELDSDPEIKPVEITSLTICWECWKTEIDEKLLKSIRF